MKLSLPVFIGYFSVSFGFGTLAAAKRLSALEAAVISLTNLTSAGQFAGLSVIVSSAPLIDMVITQLVINSRYALMSLALSQKMGDGIGLLPRFFIAFHNTDEIFALAMEYGKPLTVPFMMGLGILPILGWTGGTLLGALAGTFLPESVRTALSVALYGMFIAIVVPQAKKASRFSALCCCRRLLPALLNGFLFSVRCRREWRLSSVPSPLLQSALCYFRKRIPKAGRRTPDECVSVYCRNGGDDISDPYASDDGFQKEDKKPLLKFFSSLYSERLSCRHDFSCYFRCYFVNGKRPCGIDYRACTFLL